MKITAKFIKIFIALITVIGGAGTYYYVQRGEVSTDDAAINGSAVILSPKV